MPSRPSVVVDVCRPAPDRLPDELVESALRLGDLQRRGFFEQVGERLRLRRKAGSYVGIDLVAFLIAYHASGLMCGVREFVDRFRGHGPRLAALAGRRRQPATSSISRLARSVQDETLDEVVPWLLCEVADPWALLAHPSVLTRDHRGQGWHVFDFDHTRLALLQRPLPRGDDLPEATRVSEDLAAPGFTGRGRGNVVVNRAALQHVGSSLWLDCRLSAGNPPNRSDLSAALDIVRDVVRRARGDRARVLLRLDGAFGHVPHITACLEAGVPFVARIARYDLLDQADVREGLAGADWRVVPSTGAGPERFATELGQVWLRPGRKIRRGDGTEYAQVQVRVVVTRRRSRKDERHGRVLDGWLYELYATSVVAADWPDHELVALYAGRAGQENRFAQEDRELCVERVVSYHLPGQRLSCAIGLMMWNLRVLQGFELRPPPDEPPPQPERAAAPHRLPGLAPPEDDTHAGKDDDGPGGSDDDGDARSLQERRLDAEREVAGALAGIDWQRRLRRLPGWRWDADSAVLRCPADKTLVLTSVLKQPGGTPTVQFSARKKDCHSCPTRPICMSTSKSGQVKRIGVSVRGLDHESLSTCITLSARLRRQPTDPPRGAPAASRTTTAGTARPLSWRPPPDEVPPTGTATATAWFEPAAARRRARRSYWRLEVHVRVGLPEDLAPPDPRSRATTTARNRRSWTERTAAYALPTSTGVRLRYHGLDDDGAGLTQSALAKVGAMP
jgi:hypothetical protein